MCHKDKALALGLHVCVYACVCFFDHVCVCGHVCYHVYVQAAHCSGPLGCECVYSAAQEMLHRVAYDRLTLLLNNSPTHRASQTSIQL